MCGLQTTWAPASHCPAAVRVQTCPADAVWKSVLCNEPLTVAQGKTCMMFQKYPCWVIKTSTDQWMIQNHYNCNRNIRYHTTIYYIYNKKKTDHVYTSHLHIIGSSLVAMFQHVPWPHAVATWRSRDKKNSIDESTPLKNQRKAMKFCEIVWFFVFWGFCWLPSGKLEQKLSRRFRESQIIFSWAKQNLEQRFHHFTISRIGTINIYIYSICSPYPS